MSWSALLRDLELAPVDLSGKYRIDLQRSENSEDFLRLAGQNYILRKAAQSVRVDMTVTQFRVADHPGIDKPPGGGGGASGPIAAHSCPEDYCRPCRVNVSSYISLLRKTVDWFQVLDGRQHPHAEQDGSVIQSNSFWIPDANGGTWRMTKKDPKGYCEEDRWLTDGGKTLVCHRWLKKGNERASFTAYFPRIA